MPQGDHYRAEIEPIIVAKMYRGGMSIREIAAHFGCAAITVQRRMEAAGVKARSSNASANAKEFRLQLIREIAKRRANN